MAERQDITKMSLAELKETLQRETLILQNRRLVENLPDQGQSIEKFKKMLENEIKYKENMELIENGLEKLSLSDHVERLCNIERDPTDRFKPYATLNTTKEINPNSKLLKVMEDCRATSKPTQSIPLRESMTLLEERDIRLKKRKMLNVAEHSTEEETEEDTEEISQPDSGAET